MSLTVRTVANTAQTSEAIDAKAASAAVDMPQDNGPTSKGTVANASNNKGSSVSGRVPHFRAGMRNPLYNRM